MIIVTLYRREECHLCETILDDLRSLQMAIPHKVVEIGIDGNPEFEKKFGHEIPIVEIGPYRLKAPISHQELAITLGAARDRQAQIDEINNPNYQPSIQTQWSNSDRFSYWLSNHYVALLNLLVLVYLGLPVFAPVLMRAGLVKPANLIYRGYGFVCHQLAFRSFFLFGEQYVYPREAAGLEGVLSYSQATGLSEASTEADLFAARSFTGNEEIGYKIALCQRDVAIYGSIFLFGLLFAITGRKLKPLPWYFWIILGLVPIGIDGFSQLLSQPPLSLWDFRESTPALRVVTGFLFGFTTAWFGYPLVEQAMLETRTLMAQRRMRVLRGFTIDVDDTKSTSD